jgi:hypothetical protein
VRTKRPRWLGVTDLAREKARCRHGLSGNFL